MNKAHYKKEEPTRPEGVISFIILSFTVESIYYKMKDALEKKFSKILFESNPLLGWIPLPVEVSFSPLGNKSRILSFKRRMNREELPEMKEKCIQIANAYSKLDASIKIMPGYQTQHNTILASTLDDFHKIYLFHGIYAEVIYKYESRQLQPVDTIPLYFANKEVIYYFTNLREYYNQSKQIK